MPTVLLVEDDPDVRDLIETALTDRGLQVRTAADDRAAQRHLDREAAQTAVLIADIHLGSGPSGFDIARRAKRLNPRIEVVYITGRAPCVDRVSVDGGVLVPKPFNVEHLGDMIEALAADPV